MNREHRSSVLIKRQAEENPCTIIPLSPNIRNSLPHIDSIQPKNVGAFIRRQTKRKVRKKLLKEPSKFSVLINPDMRIIGTKKRELSFDSNRYMLRTYEKQSAIAKYIEPLNYAKNQCVSSKIERRRSLVIDTKIGPWQTNDL